MRKLYYLIGLLTALSTLSPHAASRPNILIILLDDLGYSDLGCYGGEIPTPHIDQLGKGGLRFTQMTNSARCCPSRASLLTGLHPPQAGIADFTGRPNPRLGPAYLGRLSPNSVTFAEVLKSSGYQTYAVGKWHVGHHPDAIPTARGFDKFYGYTQGHSHSQWDRHFYKLLPANSIPNPLKANTPYYATDAFNQYALAFLKEAQTKQQPWLLYLAHSSPHFPIQAPYASAQKFHHTYRQGWDTLRKKRFERMKQIGLCNHEGWKLTPRSLVPVDRKDIANGYSGTMNPAWASLDPQRQEDLAHRMALYAAMVEHVDQGIGKITTFLKQSGQLDSTLILILSDNGACYEWGPFGFDGVSRTGKNILHRDDDLKKMGGPGTHSSYGSGWANLANTPFRLYKHFTHQGGIVTPMIAHWPAGIQQSNKWVREPTHVMDIFPTLLEVTGATYPQQRNDLTTTPLEGTSLSPLFKGESLPKRTLYYQHQKARAIRKGPWKLVYGKRFPSPPKWELYHLIKDPCETENLAAAHPELVHQLSEEWHTWAKRMKLHPFWKKPSNK